MFPVTSRYHAVEKDKLQTAAGKEIVYLRRRFVPQPGQNPTQGEHVVKQGERLDNITARYLGDPEQFWRLCDANNALHPAELTARIGRRLRIPLFQEG